MSIRNSEDVRQVLPDLNVEEAARALRVGKSTVHRLVTSKQLDAYRVGRFWRITPAALERFKEKGGSETE